MMETVPPGTLLRGRYRVERVLGSGGFGHVYLALDQNANIQCAVKEYFVTGTSGREQLEHEANVLSRLRHPNLPAYQDYFSERGRYYIVLSYIDGDDLTDRMRMVRQQNNIIPIAQILNWLLVICDAVTFLHNQQPPVIHRDIKPDNIRITPAGAAVLVDLGNAKAAKQGDRTLIFIRHQGTPGYAPPEQYPGGSGTDVRSDVYALGATLLFALTTQEPPTVQVRNQSVQQGLATPSSLQEYLLKNPPEASLDALDVRQFRLGVTKPSRPAPRHSRHLAQLGTLPPQLLAQLNTIVQKSMALKPKDRYQLVADLAYDLRQVVIALSPSSTPPTSPKPPVDPNSTQPDLSELYDALQDAQDKRNQGLGDGSSGKQPVLPPNVANITCPRCGTSLAPRAVFCTYCGMSLSKPTNQPPSNQQAKMHNVPGRDITAERTHITSLDEMKEAIAVKPRGAHVEMMVSAFPPYNPVQPQQSHLQHLQKLAPPQSVQPPHIGPQVIGPRGQSHNPQHMQQAPQPSRFTHWLFKNRILIACIVLFVILLVVFFLIATKQTHAAALL